MGVSRKLKAHGVIPWHRRLEARVLFGVTLVAGLSLAAIAIVTGRVVRSHTFERARNDVTTARAALTTLIGNRADFLDRQTRLIAALPVFRAHMQAPEVASDLVTMTTMASDYCRDLDAAFCVVTSADGQWLASPGIDPAPAARRALGAIVQPALANRPVQQTIALDGALYLAVAQPARFADEVLGSFLAAYRLDDALAGELSSITRSQVALIVDGAISGTSLAASQRTSLADALHRNHASGRDDVMTWELGDRQYVGGTSPLDVGRGATAARLLLLEDLEPTERFIDDTVRQLTQAGAIVFLVAVILSVVLSRRMSRPLRDIAEHAGEIAAGDWNVRLAVRGSAEAVVMAQAFNDMTQSLSHWHAQAQERAEQLQAAYERYATVTNSAPDSIVSADADGVIVFWNRSAARTFGCSEEEALGRTLASLFDDDRLPIGADGAAAAADQVPHTFEANARRHDGTIFPCEVTVAVGKADRAGSLTAIIRDITERRRADETLRLRDAQLRQAQKMEAIGRLASGVAHDFNNALAVVQGYTEDIMQSLGETHEHHQDLHEILKASQSAASLTRQLLAFSRKQAIDPQVISVSDVVRNIERMLARLVGTQNALSLSLTEGDDVIYADRGQIEQVIINLCVNARDAISDSGRVEMGVMRTSLGDPRVCERLGVLSGEYVTLAVADTGCGMDERTAAHIFEPFFTTKEAGKGTGLGLATVYGVVRQSGGGIDVETSPGRGTTFRVYLPVAHDQLAQAEDMSERDTRAGVGTVLLVEDETPLRAILRRSLEAAGYAVLEADSGDAALSVVQSHRGDIDVLLTDVVMPGMNGVVLSQAVTHRRPRIRVLFMSGHAADSFARHDFDPNAVRFLQKPFSADVLHREVHDALAA